MSDLPHDLEIESKRSLGSASGRRHRVSCSCGFNGPWRLTRKTANRDSDGHLNRMASE